MIYQKQILITYNKTQSEAIKTSIKLTRGLLYRFELYFPPGSSGLLKVQVYEKGVLIYPSTESEYFRGDNLLIAFDDTRLLSIPPYTYDIVAWNEDTKYSHSFDVRFGVLSKDELLIRYLPKDPYKALQEYIDKKEAIPEEKLESEREFLREFL